jgi:hypothetical protein
MANANKTPKRANVITKTVLRDESGMATGVHLKCVNGQELTAKLDELSAHLFAEAAAHGMSQKLGDAAALSRNPETGQSASVADKWQAVAAIFNRIFTDQEWNMEREGGGQGSLLLRALIRYYDGKKTAEDVKTWLETKTKEEQNALRKNPKIATLILEIQAEGADEELGDELLEELDAIGE